MVSELRFVGQVADGQGEFGKDHVLPGREQLRHAADSWPAKLHPGTLNVRVLEFPQAPWLVQPQGTRWLDHGSFPPHLMFPGLLITGNTLGPAAHGQAWRATLEADGSSTLCWVFRRRGSRYRNVIELVAGVGLRATAGITNETRVSVTLQSAAVLVAREQIQGPHPEVTDYLLKTEPRSRVHVDNISRSMGRSGWSGQPLLARRMAEGAYKAWCGGHRLEAARMAGLEHIPLVLVDERALREIGWTDDMLSFGWEHSDRLTQQNAAMWGDLRTEMMLRLERTEQIKRGW